MPFLVKYLQDIPQNCSECPCSIHITPKEIYCNARQKHFVVSDNRPEECEMTDANEIKENKVKDSQICLDCKWLAFGCENLRYGSCSRWKLKEE